MDTTAKTHQRWRRALGIAKILFEDAGYHTAYLEEIEEALMHARSRPEQAAFWLRLKGNREPIARADTEPYGVEFITTTARLRDLCRRYPCPTAVDVGAGVFGARAGLLFIDDADGRAVAYAPPETHRRAREGMMKRYRVERDRDGTVRATVNGKPLHHVVWHSPTGFGLGYGGSGPADLALSILADYFGERPTRDELAHGNLRCWQYHQAFKWRFIATADATGLTVTEGNIAVWVGEEDRHGAA